MAGKGINFRFPRSSGGGGLSRKVTEGETRLRQTFDGTEDPSVSVQRTNYDGGQYSKSNQDFANLPLPGERLLSSDAVKALPSEPVQIKYPFRNQGINFRFPKNSGGRFFKDRIDEGRSGLKTWTNPDYEPLPPPPEEPTNFLYAFDTRSGLNELNSGSVAYIGTPQPGTVEIQFFTGSTESAMGARRLPGFKAVLSHDFSSAPAGATFGSSSLALLQVNTGPLPKRYEVSFTIKHDGFGAAGTPFAGFYAGNEIVALDTSNFHGAAALWGAPNGNFTNKAVSFTTGAIGEYDIVGGVGEGSSFYAWTFRFLVEMVSSTGSAGANMWRFVNVAHPHANASQITNALWNTRSGSASSWENAGNLNRFGFMFGRMSGALSGSTPFTFEIRNLIINRHPKDEL